MFFKDVHTGDGGEPLGQENIYVDKKRNLRKNMELKYRKSNICTVH